MAITISGSGITSANIADGTIVNADVSDVAASKLTGALPAIDGSALTNLPGGGKVLQVVKYLTFNQSSQAITTTDSVVNSMSKTITPLGSNSQFLVSFRWIGEVAGSAWNVLFNIQMNGTRVNINGQGNKYGLASPCQSYINSNDDSTPETVNFQTLVSTNVTAGTPTTFRCVVHASTNSYTLWNNRTVNNTYADSEMGSGELIITEIGA